MQTTVANRVSISGNGLFSGQEATVTLSPADPNTGIVFYRTDLEEVSPLPAVLSNLKSTPRCTILGDGRSSVQTVEHLLSALSGCGLTNVKIEISGPEVPILDGSSMPFVRLFEEAGVRVQEEFPKIYSLTEPVYWSQGETQLMAIPSDEFRISYTLHYPDSSFLDSQFYSFAVTPEGFKNEIAPSRTFCLYEEIQPMIDQGMIKGGSLENGVIIKDDEVVNPEGVRFPEEMARHKILDLIGDLALIPIPFKAHIIAIRSGHTSNTAFAKELYKQLKSQSATAVKSEVLGTKEIKEILPHRYPFLLVDKVTYINLEENKIVGQKNLTINEEFFQGHFPDLPIMPGVLILEALAQTGGILVHQKGYKDKIALFLNVKEAKFRKPVLPGDTLMLHCEGLHYSSKGGRVKGKAMVGNKIVAEAEIGFAFINKDQI